MGKTNTTNSNSTIKQIVQPGTCAWITSGVSTEATYWIFQGLSRVAGERLEKLALELGVPAVKIIEEAIIRYRTVEKTTILRSLPPRSPLDGVSELEMIETVIEDKQSQIVDTAIESVDIATTKAKESISSVSSLNMGVSQKAAMAKQLVESALQRQKEQTIRAVQTREKGFSTNISTFPTVTLPSGFASPMPVAPGGNPHDRADSSLLEQQDRASSPATPATPVIMQTNEPVEPKLPELELEEVEKIAQVTKLILKAKDWGEIPQVSTEFSGKILAIAFKRLSLVDKKKVLMLKSFEHLLKDAKAKKQVTFYDISTDEDMFYCIVKFPDDIQETYTDSPINKSMLVDKILSFV